MTAGLIEGHQPGEPYYGNPGGGGGEQTYQTYNAPSSTPNLTGEQRNAYEYLVRIFNSYGLGSLAPVILSYIQQGYQADTIALMLQDTPEYKARFSANSTRIANGLRVLSPAEYMQLEASYRQILSAYGLPQGFYDSPDDFANWIAQDVSPAEIQSRVKLAADAVNNSDSYYLATLREYGLGNGDLIASFLDRNRALPLLEKTVREAQIGAEARRQGFGMGQGDAAYWESIGVTREQAREAYGFMSQYLPTLEQIGRRYGMQYGRGTAEQELLGGSGEAASQRRRLQTRELNEFQGQGAVGRDTFMSKSRGEF